ncbi:uncharacterized protein [Aristolochia californica]|uniref:uncharacterized protein n=1 Tax=Aristolochia californica TaxID=171875 RepID=UPI0035D989A5
MEENHPASSNDFEVVNGNERRPSATSESQYNPLSDLAEFYYDEPYNFNGEDYLEFNDLMDYPSSSSQKNSSAVSMNSDYYMDSEASFREMRNDGYPEEERNVNRMVSTTSGSIQVLMRPSPLVSEHNKETNPMTTDPQNKGGLTHPAATTDRATSQETKKWKSVAEDAKGNAIAGPSNSSSGGKRSGSSLAKMAMKFLCVSPS